MTIKKKSKAKILGFRLVKWVLFIPSLVALVVWSICLLVELFTIKAKASDHTKNDVKNARTWFIYLALPFFNQGYFSGMMYQMTSEEWRKMFEIYGKKRFNKTLKMYVPFFGSEMNAFDAVHAKNGLYLEIVGQ